VRLSITKIAPEQSILSLPLSAVRLRSDSAEVFVLSEEQTVKSAPVEVGRVNGNFVEIMTVFEESARIVKDARGLKDGQQVTVRE
jgi:hypothetical protein